VTEYGGPVVMAETKLAVEFTIHALTAYRRTLEEAKPVTPRERRELVRIGGLLTITLVDELTRVYAGDDIGGDDMLDQAQAVVASLAAPPAGFTTSVDERYHARMKTATADMLARL
jgi:hypothetical protein